MTPYDTSLGLPALFARAPDLSSLPLDLAAGAGRRQIHVTEGAAPAVAGAAVDALRAGYDLVVADFADPGNTARNGAAEALGGLIDQILDAARSRGGAVIVVGGRDATNSAHVVYANDADPGARLRDGGRWADLAPALLDLLGLPRGEDMDGTSLLVREKAPLLSGHAP
jgi:2,3-bisphosphoglycerate-independent phosphoglycerate mutase